MIFGIIFGGDLDDDFCEDEEETIGELFGKLLSIQTRLLAAIFFKAVPVEKVSNLISEAHKNKEKQGPPIVFSIPLTPEEAEEVKREFEGRD